MRFSILSVVAGASMVAATYDLPVEDTTTLTSTTTRVLTLTACPDSVVDCPYRTTTSTEEVIITSTSTSAWIPTTTPETTPTVIYTPPAAPPVVNTTSVYTPIPKTTWYPAGNTTTAGPTAPVTYITKVSQSSAVVPTTLISENAPAGTTVVEVASSAAPSSVPSEVPASGASSVFAKSGALAVVVAAMAALY
ncbi:hypothetical protein AK830_g525 [Neonectria ditissima]|uniref:Uncharacterized protein n=1 Tax=Neonectria ditissima TaxID=78410 RepID=A0A0N8H912_9HYPO|nr:hypothetical protein AK830_g525 [Neonectria ditissima]